MVRVIPVVPFQQCDTCTLRFNAPRAPALGQREYWDVRSCTSEHVWFYSFGPSPVPTGEQGWSRPSGTRGSRPSRTQYCRHPQMHVKTRAIQQHSPICLLVKESLNHIPAPRPLHKQHSNKNSSRHPTAAGHGYCTAQLPCCLTGPGPSSSAACGCLSSCAQHGANLSTQFKKVFAVPWHTAPHRWDARQSVMMDATWTHQFSTWVAFSPVAAASRSFSSPCNQYSENTMP